MVDSGIKISALRVAQACSSCGNSYEDFPFITANMESPTNSRGCVI